MGQVEETSRLEPSERYQRLVAEGAFRGVRQLTLGSVATVVRGASPRPIRSWVTADPTGTPWIKIGDVPEGGRYITSTAERIRPEGEARSRVIEPGDFILSNSMSFGRPYISKIRGCIHDGWLAIRDYEEHYDPEFLYLLMGSSPVYSELSRRAGNGAVRNINANIVRSLVLPVPSLDVQRDVVATLDPFGALLTSLAEEQVARQEQFDHYRDAMLENVQVSDQWSALGSVAEVTRGKRFVKADYVHDSTGLPAIHYADIYTEYQTVTTEATRFVRPDLTTSLRFAQKGDVIVTSVGERADEIAKPVAWLGHGSVAFHDDSFAIKHDMNPVFLAHWFEASSATEQKQRHISRGKMKRISADGLRALRLPIPAREKQDRIASRLEAMRALIFSVGAEREARRQQFEHYRDRLLTFPERTASA